jgi:hypothetical protein
LCYKKISLEGAPCLAFSGKGKNECENNKKGVSCFYRSGGICTGPKNESEMCDTLNRIDSRGRKKAKPDCKNAANLSAGKYKCSVDIFSGACVAANKVNNQKHSAEKDLCSSACSAAGCLALKDSRNSGIACKWSPQVQDLNGRTIKAARCEPVHNKKPILYGLLGVHATSLPHSSLSRSTKGSKGSRGKMGSRGSSKSSKGKKGSRASSKSSKGKKGGKGKKGSRGSSKSSKGKKPSKGKKGSRGSSKSSKGKKGKKNKK